MKNNDSKGGQLFQAGICGVNQITEKEKSWSWSFNYCQMLRAFQGKRRTTPHQSLPYFSPSFFVQSWQTDDGLCEDVSAQHVSWDCPIVDLSLTYYDKKQQQHITLSDCVWYIQLDYY